MALALGATSILKPFSILNDSHTTKMRRGTTKLINYYLFLILYVKTKTFLKSVAKKVLLIISVLSFLRKPRILVGYRGCVLVVQVGL